MMSNRIKRSTWLPAVLLVYLGVIAWIGRSRLTDGEYAYYFGVIGVSLVIIGMLHWALRKKESAQRRNEEAEYGTYQDDENGGTA